MTFSSRQESLPEGYAQYARLSLLTKAYESLQGLRMAPIWFLCVLQPLSERLPNKRPTFIHDYFLLGSVIFCLLWLWLSGKWYRKHYGSVETASNREKLLVIPGIIAVLSMYYYAAHLDEIHNPPVSINALVLVCYIAVIVWLVRGDRVRSAYYGAAAACMLLVSLVPMTGWISASSLMFPSHRHAYCAWGFFTFSLLMLIGGVLDHFLLVRRLSQSRGSLYV